jgi:hypothetical protein
MDDVNMSVSETKKNETKMNTQIKATQTGV